MAEINLLQNETSDSVSFAPQKTRKFGLIFALVLLLLAAAAYGFLFWQEQQVNAKIVDAEQQIAQLDTQIKTTEPERLEAISFQARLNNLRTLLDTHLFWSNVFEELEEFTYAPTALTSFQASELTGVISITGTTASYTDLAKLMLGLNQSEFIADVRFLTSGPAGEAGGGFSFSLEIVLDAEIFMKQIQ